MLATMPAAMEESRRTELKYLRLYLDKGTCVQIVAPRGLGKTTFLRYIEAKAPRWNPQFKPAYLDLNDPACQTLPGLVAAIWEAWGQDPARGSLRELSEFVEDWRRAGHRPLLLLDDFERITERPREFLTDFYIEMRNVADFATIVVTVCQPLGHIITQRNAATSFFANKFSTLYLGPF